MKKYITIIGFLLFTLPLYAQNVDYYGAGNAYSNNLRIAVGDSCTGEYYVNEKLIYIQVDSNWTASNIGVLVYNPYEETYEILTDSSGSIVEYPITQGKTTAVIPAEMAGAKRIKFIKITSGSDVDQATNPSTVIVHTIRY